MVVDSAAGLGEKSIGCPPVTAHAALPPDALTCSSSQVNPSDRAWGCCIWYCLSTLASPEEITARDWLQMAGRTYEAVWEPLLRQFGAADEVRLAWIWNKLRAFAPAEDWLKHLEGALAP